MEPTIDKNDLVKRINDELKFYAWYPDRDKELNALSRIRFLVDVAIHELTYKDDDDL
jgi:hypothetical protein